MTDRPSPQNESRSGGNLEDPSRPWVPVLWVSMTLLLWVVLETIMSDKVSGLVAWLGPVCAWTFTLGLTVFAARCARAQPPAGARSVPLAAALLAVPVAAFSGSVAHLAGSDASSWGGVVGADLVVVFARFGSFVPPLVYALGTFSMLVLALRMVREREEVVALGTPGGSPAVSGRTAVLERRPAHGVGTPTPHDRAELVDEDEFASPVRSTTARRSPVVDPVTYTPAERDPAVSIDPPPILRSSPEPKPYQVDDAGKAGVLLEEPPATMHTEKAFEPKPMTPSSRSAVAEVEPESAIIEATVQTTAATDEADSAGLETLPAFLLASGDETEVASIEIAEEGPFTVAGEDESLYRAAALPEIDDEEEAPVTRLAADFEPDVDEEDIQSTEATATAAPAQDLSEPTAADEGELDEEEMMVALARLALDDEDDTGATATLEPEQDEEQAVEIPVLGEVSAPSAKQAPTVDIQAPAPREEVVIASPEPAAEEAVSAPEASVAEETDAEIEAAAPEAPAEPAPEAVVETVSEPVEVVTEEVEAAEYEAADSPVEPAEEAVAEDDPWAGFEAETITTEHEEEIDAEPETDDAEPAVELEAETVPSPAPTIAPEDETADLFPGASDPAEATPSEAPSADVNSVEAGTSDTPSPAPAPPTTAETSDSLFSHRSEIEEETFAKAVGIVTDANRCSVAMLQRSLEVSFSEATALIERMFDEGVVGPQLPSGRRKILTKKKGRSSPKKR